MDKAEREATELSRLQIEKENEKWARRAANTGIPVIQSGHTFLQIILLIIPEHSIAAPKSAWIMSAQPLPTTQQHFQLVWRAQRT